jgi:hypothetical protein
MVKRNHGAMQGPAPAAAAEVMDLTSSPKRKTPERKPPSRPTERDIADAFQRAARASVSPAVASQPIIQPAVIHAQPVAQAVQTAAAVLLPVAQSDKPSLLPAGFVAIHLLSHPYNWYFLKKGHLIYYVNKWHHIHTHRKYTVKELLESSSLIHGKDYFVNEDAALAFARNTYGECDVAPVIDVVEDEENNNDVQPAVLPAVQAAALPAALPGPADQPVEAPVVLPRLPVGFGARNLYAMPYNWYYLTGSGLQSYYWVKSNLRHPDGRKYKKKELLVPHLLEGVDYFVNEEDALACARNMYGVEGE